MKKFPGSKRREWADREELRIWCSPSLNFPVEKKKKGEGGEEQRKGEERIQSMKGHIDA